MPRRYIGQPPREEPATRGTVLAGAASRSGQSARGELLDDVEQSVAIRVHDVPQSG